MTEPFSFRGLCEAVMRYQGKKLYQEVLLPVRTLTLDALDSLRKYGEPEAIRWKLYKSGKAEEAFLYDLFTLYGLSRISDLLLVEVGISDETDRYPTISEGDRQAYWTSLGMSPITQANFHPFFHEIVEVEQSPDPDEQITLVEEIWMGFLLGQMMFCRAGVKVRGGINHVVKDIAENSLLYFTYRRGNRLCKDLSYNWGSNSQWKTTFRRDYETEDAFYYNLDVPLVSRDALSDLAQAEKIELLTHRCFVKTLKSHHDLFPYNETYTEQKTSS